MRDDDLDTNDPFAGQGADEGRPLRQRRYEKVTSPWAYASLIFALLSAPAMVCLCIPNILTGLIAAVCGHLAMSQANRSEGRVGGWGMGLFGVVTGYAFMVVGIGWLLFVAFGPKPEPVARTPAQAALKEAEDSISSERQGAVHGNSVEARALAKAYSEAMGTLDKELFTEVKFNTGVKQYVTWCELHEGRCAFIVHVPQYRKFEKDAKQQLADLAWAAAERTVSGILDEGDELAVALKGDLLWGAVMTGTVVRPEDNLTAGRLRSGASSTPLEEFFEPGPVEAEEMPEEAMPAEDKPAEDKPDDLKPDDAKADEEPKPAPEPAPSS